MRHLAIAVAVKLMALALLWWCFIDGHRVAVDASHAAAHLGMASAAQGGQP
ncbi:MULTISPECIES: cytochrome oxidase putative small subunit CydP [Cupriavidus]|uniref:cytochrome oxidase putative small subunit CydP n=1 Tax=Cupriavidus TaxID=106589 RepID=UPI0030037E20